MLQYYNFISYIKRLMKFNFFKIYSAKFIFTFCILFSSKVSLAQNCTVNAGIDGVVNLEAVNYRTANMNVVYPLFQLNGNSAGNINATPNLLWELVSAPVGANLSFVSASSNNTYVVGRYRDLPSGIYKYRLGITCLTGGIVYDTVQVTVNNTADFYMYADKAWSTICSNVQDSIKLVARPLKANEGLLIDGRAIDLTATNACTQLGLGVARFFGPTADSIRFTIKNNNFNVCNSNLSPYFSFNIFNNTNGNTFAGSDEPIINNIPERMGNLIPFASKIAFRNTDTATCINQNSIFDVNNICVKGVSGITPTSITRLTGSGLLNYSLTRYSINNNWDTVTNNTLHSFELTFPGNSCYASFKDTIKLFFKSAKPTTNGITFSSNTTFCLPASSYPLATIKIPFITGGTIPSKYKLFTKAFNGYGFTVVNPYRTDTIELVGNITSSNWDILTTFTDTTTGCNLNYSTSFNLKIQRSLPILRDTTICSNNVVNQVEIPYPFIYSSEYAGELVGNNNGSTSAYVSITYNRIFVNNLLVGEYDVRIFKNPNNSNACTDGRSDTFHISILSGGRPSNAGTDQSLLCNVNTTNLAGSAPTSTGGVAGFWKFLPAISSNAGAPIVISDSTNRSTGISGLINLSTYYFSWNVTNGNTGNYCNLQPDTVRVIFSGIAPSNNQAAQIDSLGLLPLNATYSLTSNAVTPTFNVQWNKLSGPAGAVIVSPNSQNTNVTGLTKASYSFELVVNNACGTFKDTVNLVFAPHIWAGITSTDWNTASNWNVKNVPINIDSALVPAGTLFSAITTNAHSLKELTLNTGATITLNGNLSLNGNSIINGTILGPATCIFNGTNPQSVIGDGTIDKATINSGSNVIVNTGSNIKIR